MTRLTADDAMLALLRQAKELAEVCDASGRVVGFFAPVALEHAATYAEAAARIDPAEIQRRKTEPGRNYTTREVFEHLLSLTQDEKMRASLQTTIERLAERDRCDTP
jgi:hypothetical protein